MIDDLVWCKFDYVVDVYCVCDCVVVVLGEVV